MNNIFKQHPDLAEYFETSDGEKFYKEDLAKNHVRTLALKDAAIKIVLRPDENQSRAEVISLVPHMKQELVAEYLNAENDADEPNAEFIEALTNRNAQLQAISSANSSAAEFENSHADVNVIHEGDAVILDHAAGAPFEMAETVDAAAAEVNTVNAPLEVVNTDSTNNDSVLTETSNVDVSDTVLENTEIPVAPKKVRVKTSK